MAHRCLWLLIGCASLMGRAALAEDAALQHAKQLIDDVKFDEAAAALKAVRTHPGLSHSDLLDTLSLLGVTSSALGNSDEADRYFRELVVIAPDFKLSRRWGPKIQTSFFSAKAWLDEQQPMSLSRQPPLTDKGAIVGVQVQVGPDPLHLVKGVRAHLSPESGSPSVETRPAAAQSTVALPVAPTASLKWWAESLGAHDEVLQVLASADAPLVDASSPVAAAPLAPAPSVHELTATEEQRPAAKDAPAAAELHASSEPEPVYRPLAYALLGTGVVALAVGIVLGVSEAGIQNRLNSAATDASGRVTGMTQAQAQNLVNQSKTEAVAADALIAGGAALAVAGGGVFLYGSLNPESPGSGGEFSVGGSW